MQYTALTSDELLGVLERAPSLSPEEKDKLLAAVTIRFQQLLGSKSDQIDALHNSLERIKDLIDHVQDDLDITYK